MDKEINKVAVITGADLGVEREISERLALLGIHTVSISNNSDSLEGVKSDFQIKHAKLPSTISLDVRSKSQIDKAIDEVLNQYGKIDYLINVAGVAFFNGIELCTEEEWDETLNINVKGYFLIAKSIFPHMKLAGEGMIINMSSTWGMRGSSTMISYSTSKFTTEEFTKSLSEEARQYGIMEID